MIIAAIILGSLLGTMLATLSYFALGLSLVSALMVYAIASLVPAALAAFNIFIQLMAETSESLRTHPTN